MIKLVWGVFRDIARGGGTERPVDNLNKIFEQSNYSRDF